MAITDGYGIRHVGIARGNDLPHPTTFIVGPDGTLLKMFFNDTFRSRPDPKDVLLSVEEAARS